MTLTTHEPLEATKAGLERDTKTVVKRIVEDALAKAARDTRKEAQVRKSARAARRRTDTEGARTRYHGD